MIRMLVVGYVFAIRSERLICREVQVNLAYRWFCKLGIIASGGQSCNRPNSSW
jgi:transposase